MKIKNQNIIRIIPRLDIKNGLLIKGINLEGLRILGNPYSYANKYYNDGADEIFYIDNVASLYGTNNLSEFITLTAKNISIPFTVGGGIKSISDIDRTLRNGADKVSMNTAILNDISLLKKSSKVFGSSTISSNVEVIKINKKYYISSSNGRDLHEIDVLDWVRKIEDNGVGEIIITSVNNEGLRKGFDIPLIKKITKCVHVPVVAHGGAGDFKQIYDVIVNCNVSGISIASMFHYNYIHKTKFKNKLSGNTNFLNNFLKLNNKKTKIRNLIQDLKKYLKNKKINVRL
tara:strand:+ start:7877 stop:8740 length:864 start_codon:yes stop_codon:yes gene_type:complete